MRKKTRERGSRSSENSRGPDALPGARGRKPPRARRPTRPCAVAGGAGQGGREGAAEGPRLRGPEKAERARAGRPAKPPARGLGRPSTSRVGAVPRLLFNYVARTHLPRRPAEPPSKERTDLCWCWLYPTKTRQGLLKMTLQNEDLLRFNWEWWVVVP